MPEEERGPLLLWVTLFVCFIVFFTYKPDASFSLSSAKLMKKVFFFSHSWKEAALETPHWWGKHRLCPNHSGMLRGNCLEWVQVGSEHPDLRFAFCFFYLLLLSLLFCLLDLFYNSIVFPVTGHQRSPWLGEVHRRGAWQSVVCHRICWQNHQGEFRWCSSLCLVQVASSASQYKGVESFHWNIFDPPPQIWDLFSGKLKLSLTGHISTVRGVAVSTRSPYLFSCGEDKQVKCWDLEYNKVGGHFKEESRQWGGTPRRPPVPLCYYDNNRVVLQSPSHVVSTESFIHHQFVLLHTIQ